MTSGLYYQGSGFSVPHHVINEKAEQLKKAVPQFFNMDTPFKSGHYVIYKWAFVEPKDHRSSSIMFKVELWDLSSTQTYLRQWEMKGSELLADKELKESNPFVLCGYLYAGWWQPLIGKALSQTDNKSLSRAVDGGLRDSKIKCLRINVVQGFLRLKNVMGKAFGGFEYDINVEITDERKKIHKLRWLIYCTKDFSFCQLVDSQVNAKINIDNSVQFAQEKEKLILAIRDELTRQGKIIKSGDWVVDQYYIREINSIRKGYSATVILLVTNQQGNSKVLEVMVTKMNSQYEINNVQNLYFDFNTLAYLEQNGSKLNRWQLFSKKATTLNNSCIRKLADIGLEALGRGATVLEVNKAECRVKRNSEISIDDEEETVNFMGFEYKVVFRVKEPNGSVNCQEWLLYGNPCSEDEFKLVHTRKIKPNRSLTPQPNAAEEYMMGRSQSPRSKSNLHDNSSILLPSHRLNESITDEKINRTYLPTLRGINSNKTYVKGYDIETRKDRSMNSSLIHDTSSSANPARKESPRKYVFNFKLKPIKKTLENT